MFTFSDMKRNQLIVLIVDEKEELRREVVQLLSCGKTIQVAHNVFLIFMDNEGVSHLVERVNKYYKKAACYAFRLDDFSFAVEEVSPELKAAIEYARLRNEEAPIPPLLSTP